MQNNATPGTGSTARIAVARSYIVLLQESRR